VRRFVIFSQQGGSPATQIDTTIVSNYWLPMSPYLIKYVNYCGSYEAYILVKLLIILLLIFIFTIMPNKF